MGRAQQFARIHTRSWPGARGAAYSICTAATRGRTHDAHNYHRTRYANRHTSWQAETQKPQAPEACIAQHRGRTSSGASEEASCVYDTMSENSTVTQSKRSTNCSPCIAGRQAGRVRQAWLGRAAGVICVSMGTVRHVRTWACTPTRVIRTLDCSKRRCAVQGECGWRQPMQLVLPMYKPCFKADGL